MNKDKFVGNDVINKLTSRISLARLFSALATAAMIILTVVMFFVFMKYYKTSMESNAVTRSEQAVMQVEHTIKRYVENIADTQKLIRRTIHEGSDLDAFFNFLLKSQSDIVAITMYDQEGKIENCWCGNLTLKDNIVKNLSYEDIKDRIKTDKSVGKLTISKPHVESIFKGAYPWVVTLSDEVYDNEGIEHHLSLDIRFSSIARYVDSVGIGEHGYCFVVDNNGEMVYHPQQQLIYAGLKSERTSNLKEGVMSDEDVIYTVASTDEINWRIVGVCYIDEMISQKVNDITWILVLAIVIVLIFTIVIGIVFSELFSRPARRLVGAMRRFEGGSEDFTFTPIGGTKEINTLSDSFKYMIARIEKLMEQVRNEEISLRKTELKALQAQINPHFLYNTLDSIAWMCEDGRNQEAEEMVNALARLFRISISKGHELITIDKELQHAKSYLKIQKFRYKNQFSYRFDVDEDCLKYLCNKITLQPIIENAIYHGINMMVDEGEINIGIAQNDKDIIFTVIDNGIGMSEEQCREILNKEPGDRTGIGIKNVNDRIKIYFGSQYGLRIESEPDEGTCVTITMPKIMNGVDDE